MHQRDLLSVALGRGSRQVADEVGLLETRCVKDKRKMRCRADVIFLGARMVGVSVALHLQTRRRDVVLLDRSTMFFRSLHAHYQCSYNSLSQRTG